jgi:hypothetical protein
VLDLLRPDGSTTNLVTPPGGRHVSGFAIDRSDGDRLVWVEADDLGRPQLDDLRGAGRWQSPASSAWWPGRGPASIVR